MTRFFALGLLLATNATTRSKMLQKCPDGVDSWDDIDSDEWVWDDDWEDQIADGATVYPAGFRDYTLGRYNDPPVCMFVPGSKNKKVEILIESQMENVNLCVTDADYNGMSNNNVGAVSNCGTGKIYACFTAAQAEAASGQTAQNFGFIVTCDQGCEDMDIDILIRVRLSSQTWDDGKTGVADDLEHWCEGERGKTFTINNVEQEGKLFYTYPSDLVPDEPSSYPFHIQQIFGMNAGSSTKPHMWLVSSLALVGLACLFA